MWITSKNGGEKKKQLSHQASPLLKRGSLAFSV